jgi:hypothetical protein
MTRESHHYLHGQDEVTKWEEKRCTELQVTRRVEAERGEGRGPKKEKDLAESPDSVEARTSAHSDDFVSHFSHFVFA